MATQVETPHFAHPFSFGTLPNGRKVALVDDQHSEEEIVACVNRIALTRRGTRDELPTFGISDPAFEQAPVDADTLVNEIREWEPRANLDPTVKLDTFDELVTHVALNVSPDNRGEE